ncbi:MAG TPA: DUF4034 domain-containing protein [Steroidobacteraceae bacterium]|nr:DUF4034 domain-containing protein [Steroidobacteraceae bacterium]
MGQEIPDATALAWLKSKNYAALDSYLGGLQRGYESHGVSERRLYEGFRGLYEDQAFNVQDFDRWVLAFPISYVARTARGAYYYRMGQAIRGNKFIEKTPPEQIVYMTVYLARARSDLLESMKMTARPYVTALYMLNIERLSGSPESRRYWLDRGNTIDPQNELLRLRYMDSLRPRWGGSVEAMRSFRAETELHRVPAALLAKFDIEIETESAFELTEPALREEAFRQWEKVLKLLAETGEAPSDDVLIGYARNAWGLNRRPDADRALELLSKRKVDDAHVLTQMGWLYVQEQRMKEAWPVLQKAATLNDPWAQFSVGKTTYLGCPDINLPANRQAGLVWMRRSADQGFAEAKSFLLDAGQ